MLNQEHKQEWDHHLQNALAGTEPWNLPENMMNNKEFILELFKQNYYHKNLYSHLSKDLSRDPEIFSLCLQKGDRFSYGIDYDIVHNKELILSLASVFNHENIDKLHGHYDLDKDFLNSFLKTNFSYFLKLKKRIANHFFNKKSFIIDSIKSTKEKKSLISIYRIMPLKLQQDLEIIHFILKENPSNIDYIPDDLKDSKDFMMYVINKYQCVKKVNSTLANDIDIVKALITVNGKCLLDYPQFQNNEEIVNIALSTYPHIDIIGESIIIKKEVVLPFLIKNPENCEKLLKKAPIFSNDLDIMKLCVQKNYRLLSHSNTLYDNEELRAISVNVSKNIILLTPLLMKDRELVISLLNFKEDNIHNAIQNIDFICQYGQDKEIVQLIINSFPNMIESFPYFKHDKEMIIYALSKKLNNVSFIDSNLLNDKELMASFLEKSFSNYKKLPYDLKNDMDFILPFIHNSTAYLEVIKNSNFINDYNFHIAVISRFPQAFELMSPMSSLYNNPHIILHYLSSTKDKNIPIVLNKDIIIQYGEQTPDTLNAIILKHVLTEKLDYKLNKDLSKPIVVNKVKI